MVLLYVVKDVQATFFIAVAHWTRKSVHFRKPIASFGTICFHSSSFLRNAVAVVNGSPNRFASISFAFWNVSSPSKSINPFTTCLASPLTYFPRMCNRSLGLIALLSINVSNAFTHIVYFRGSPLNTPGPGKGNRFWSWISSNLQLLTAELAPSRAVPYRLGH